ncbi:SDR family oxidoreductase [Halieaceae bacterium IMCC14734]|uniref:SDR family oxidoreductase n=1 Tax=Candidatus Litorirhabdus singularis TaxID=2518993 RepID=A0ABT3THZ2_9GAMM|nr:SDR family oxidoreductase [Candidatus Litorirhabdus singularis]MCX2981619.1 SDR family oxidoreductase [Candidatus Litorirhabdus singularis]
MLEQLFSLQGKTCVITGGSRGLGYAMAKAFLAAGARRVYITARKAEACEQAAAELSADGACVALPGDISQMAEIERLVAELSDREESIDVLVNNAGVGWLAPLDQFPEKGWDKVMDLNVKTPFFLTKALLPLLSAGGSVEHTASVINIGSIAGIKGVTDTFSYAPSKAAVHQMTRNLATELAERNIRVNAIAPGRFHTAMTDYAKADTASYEGELRAIPLHRWGEDPDIMGAALLLASNAGAFITGQIIAIDGGTTLT